MMNYGEKICRVMLTTQCVNNCSYCCNKMPAIQKSFKMALFDQLAGDSEYGTFNITGGEPLLAIDKLFTFISKIKEANNFPNPKIYLYTSGYTPDLDWHDIYKLSDLIDGVNISLHREDKDLNKGNFDDRAVDRIKFWLNFDHNVRVHIHEPDISKELYNRLYELPILIKCWTMNDCDNEDDARFII